MLRLLTLVGLIALAGCARTPRTVERVETLICPATPPSLVCPGWRPAYRPSGVHELQVLYLERGQGLSCRDTLIALWESTRASCEAARPEAGS